MGFEKPDPLLEILARMEKKIEENEGSFRTFETETGFNATVSFYEDETKELTLRNGGLVSKFSIQNNLIEFISLRGPDEEHIDTPNSIALHKSEAERLLKTQQLEKYSVDDDGQFQLV